MGLFDFLADPARVNTNPGADQTVAGNARANWNAAMGNIVNPITEFKEQARETALSIAEDAKALIYEPFQNVVSSTIQIAKKAVPTALSASASVQYLGGTPSFASFLQPWNLRSKFLLIGPDRHERIGWPCESFQTLNTLSGFVMCENVRLEIPGTANASGATLEEQQLIKQYLENGCFIE